MIRTVNLDTNSQAEVTPTTLKTLNLKNTWLELVEPTKEEVECVSDKTGVPQNFLELPAADGLVNLRLDDNFTIVNFAIIQDVITSKEVHPIVMGFCKDFLVTVSKKADQHIIDLAKKRMSKTKIDPPAQVIYFIIDEAVSNHFTQLEKIEELTSAIEEEVLEKTSQQTLKNIFTLKSNLITLNKTLWYERSLVFNLKKCGDTCMPAKTRALFDATHEALTRQIDIVETYREILSDAINVHLSATSNKINFSIKSLTVVIFYLTVITTLTSFPNTVATFFGISQFGNTDTPIIAATITLSIILPLLWLWRKRWLKYND
ncbi:MAG: magnesium transporter CorA family protein [Candidatus Bathyarchaeia archaeon]|jgi:magnesium transporter